MPVKNNEIIEKSHPLVQFKEDIGELDMGDLKLIDAYLSRIDPRKPEKREVVFSLKEYCDILGVAEISGKKLKERTKKMLGKNNALIVPTDDGWAGIVLFSRCEYKKSTAQITMKCSEDAAPYIFDIASLGYIKYKLQYIVRLKSRHTYFLYLYLIENKFRTKWSIDLEPLRKDVFRIASDYYDTFKFFHRDVLRKSCDEINEKTDIRVSYSIQKAGHKATAIEFTAEHVQNITEPKTQKQIEPNIGKKRKGSDDYETPPSYDLDAIMWHAEHFDPTKTKIGEV